MSCRVLKRGMEEFVINCLVCTAQENGYEAVLAEYIPTAKNAMVKNIYTAMGFTETDAHQYQLKTGTYFVFGCGLAASISILLHPLVLMAIKREPSPVYLKFVSV